MEHLKNSGHAESKFRATNSMGYNRVSMLKCTSLEIFRPKITLKEAQIKRVKSPGKIIYSVSLGREGDPNCCAQELAIRRRGIF